MPAEGSPWARRAAWLLLAIAAAGSLAALSLRGDKTHVFERYRGDYGRAVVLRSMRGGGSSVRLIELRNHREEAPLKAFVRRPTELADDYRIVLLYAGAKTGEKVLELVPDRPDLVLVAPQYPYESPRGLWAHLRFPRDLRRAAFRTVAGGMLAVSFLEVSEGLDLGRLAVVGSSVGSAFAALHGAVDPRVPRVVLIHGGGGFPSIIRFMERRRGRFWAGEAKALLAELLVDSFDPIHYVDRIAPRRLILIGARDDGAFPRQSLLALYERAGEPKTLIWTDGDHVRSHRDDIIAEVLELVDRELAIPAEGRSPRTPLPPQQHQDGDPDQQVGQDESDRSPVLAAPAEQPVDDRLAVGDDR